MTEPAWTPFEDAGVDEDAASRAVRLAAGLPMPLRLYVNSRYTVLVYRAPVGDGWPSMTWLSIRRNDREHVRDWRDLQRIKCEIVGPENEAVELFPAESRLVDTSNQFHLFVLDDPAARFPFGWTQRIVAEGSLGRSRQRPFEDGARPADCRTQADIDATVRAVRA